VNAFDFVLKPVSYYAFVSKLHRLCNEILGKKKVHSVTIVDRKGISNIAIDNILFFEVANHSTSIHMIDGQVVKTRKALSSFAKELSEHHFVLCNSCYLVNIAHVEKVDLDDVFVGEHRLKISRNKRKEFLKEVAQYFSRTT
jgi:DNA-binding LytR/AlgR family response regulator